MSLFGRDFAFFFIVSCVFKCNKLVDTCISIQYLLVLSFSDFHRMNTTVAFLMGMMNTNIEDAQKSTNETMS